MIPRLSLRHYLARITGVMAGATLATATHSATAGTMSTAYTMDMYRNFAENRGIFDINATNITIYDKNGNVTGTIARMMNFDCSIDMWRDGSGGIRSGEGTLAGAPNFIIGVQHDFVQTRVTFATRFGATGGTVYFDEYNIVATKAADYSINPMGESNGINDARVSRLSKIVTEATASELLVTFPTYESFTTGEMMRVGGGKQYLGTTTSQVASEYMYLTGGVMKVRTTGNVSKFTPMGEIGSGANKTEFEVFRFSFNESNPLLPMGSTGNGGDSGSGNWWYNPADQKWYYMGATTAGTFTATGAASTCTVVNNNQWAASIMSGYDQKIITSTTDGLIQWSIVTNSNASTMTQDSTTIANYTALNTAFRGDTSTFGVRAADVSIGECKNLIFSGAAGTIEITGKIDTGAGYLQFDTNYTLKNTNASSRLNSAGWVVSKNVTLTSQMNAAAGGDEWRMIGDGTVRIEGTGDNLASLNIGGNLTVVLGRTDGLAASSIKINGGNAIVQLSSASQISSAVNTTTDIIFGHRGGILDLHGFDFTNKSRFVISEGIGGRPSGGFIATLDDGARIGNLATGTTSTFYHTNTEASKYVGGFVTAAGATLNVSYSGGGTGVWTLTGNSTHAGAWTVNSGSLILLGVLDDYYGNTADYNVAVLASTGGVQVANGAFLTAAEYSRLGSNVNMATGSTLTLNNNVSVTGNVALVAGSTLNAAVATNSSEISGVISGNTVLTKSGAGMLILSNVGNTFTGNHIVNGGVVRVSDVAALGTGSANWTINSAGSILLDGNNVTLLKSKINTASTGAIALVGAADTAQLNMAGLTGVSLGVMGAASIGTVGTTATLAGWTASGGYAFGGGGGGELIVHTKLTGTGATVIGGAGKNIVVDLRATDMASYTGTITVSSGSSIIMSGVNLITQISGSSSGTLLIRGNVSDNYNFTGRASLRFGTDTGATYSGTLSGNSYTFGGTGTLRLTSVISGSATISSGTHVWLNTSNTIAGTITISAGATLQIGDGAIGGSIGSGSVVINTGGKLVFSSNANITIGTVMSGYGSVTKDGTGTAILTATSTYTTSTTVLAGALQLGNGGTNGAVSNNSQMNLSNGTQLIFNRSDSFSYNGYIRGVDGLGNTAQVVKMGSGSLTLQNWQNNYSGGTIVREGTLILVNATAAGSGTITMEGGTLDLNGQAATNAVRSTIAGATIMNYGAYVGTVTADASVRMQGGIVASTTRAVVQNNAILSFYQAIGGAATTLQSVNFTGGKLNFELTGAWAILGAGQSTQYTMLASGSTIGSLANVTWTGVALSANYTTAWSQVGNNLILTLTNTSVPNADLIWQGNSGTWNTTATSWYAANDVTHTPRAFQAGDVVIFTDQNAGTVTLSGALTPASVTVNGGAYIFQSGSIAGAGTTLTVTNTGTILTLTTANTYGGGTTLANGGTLVLGVAGALGATSVIFDGGILKYGAGITTDISAKISNTGLSAINRVNVDVNGNNVTWATDKNFLNVMNTGAAGAKLTYTGTLLNGTTGYNFQIAADATLVINTVTNQGASGTNNILRGLALGGGSGVLELQGAVNILMGNTNGFTGTIKNSITGPGLLIFAWDGSTTPHSNRFALDTGASGSGTIFTSTAVATTYLLSSISGAGNIRFDFNVLASGGDGVRHVNLEMSGNNTWGGIYAYTGTSATRGGNFIVGSKAGTGTHTLALSQSSGSAQSNCLLSVTNANVKFTATAIWLSTITLNAGGTVEYAGTSHAQTTVISGVGGVVKSGTGTLTLSGANTYTGGTVVSAGMLNATTAGALGGTAVLKNALTVTGGTVNISVAQANLGATAISAGSVVLSGTGTLGTTGVVTVSGTGTLNLGGLALSNAITYSGGVVSNYGAYTGTVTVAGNGLVLNNAYKASATINSGATLTLQGNLSGSTLFTLNQFTNNGTLAFDFTNGAGLLGAGEYTVLTASSGNTNWGTLFFNTDVLASGMTFEWKTSTAGTLVLKVLASALPNVEDDKTAAYNDVFNSVTSAGTLAVGDGIVASIQGDIAAGGAVGVTGGTVKLGTAASPQVASVGGVVNATSSDTGVAKIEVTNTHGIVIAPTGAVSASNADGSNTVVVSNGTMTAGSLTNTVAGVTTLAGFNGTAAVNVAGGTAIIKGGAISGGVTVEEASTALFQGANSITGLSVAAGAKIEVEDSSSLNLGGNISVIDVKSGTSGPSFANRGGGDPNTLSETPINLTLDSRLGGADLVDGTTLKLDMEYDSLRSAFTAAMQTFDFNLLLSNFSLAEDASISVTLNLPRDFVFDLTTDPTGTISFNWDGIAQVTHSITYVPEPTTATLGLIGIAALLLRRRRKA